LTVFQKRNLYVIAHYLLSQEVIPALITGQTQVAESALPMMGRAARRAMHWARSGATSSSLTAEGWIAFEV
jgi:hypothetical protein